MIRKKVLLVVLTVAMLTIAGCSTSTESINSGDGEDLNSNGGALEEKQLHPQEPSEQSVTDTTHYENSSYDRSNQNYTYSTEEMESLMMERINDFRGRNDVVRVNHSVALSSSASTKAFHMAENDYYAHTSPGGVTAQEFIDSVGQCSVEASENIDIAQVGEPTNDTLAGGGSEAVIRDVFQAWKNSDEGHRETLLQDGDRRSDVEMGVGIYIERWDQNNDILRVYAVLHTCSN